LLVSFAWMLVEGVHLYVMVITVFENSKEQLRIYGLCAYGETSIVSFLELPAVNCEVKCMLHVKSGIVKMHKS